MSALTYTYNSTSTPNPSSPNSPINNSSISPNGSPTSQSIHHLRGHPGSDSPLRSYTWRTESVLYFFIDTWLRYDVDANRELPSSEFIRCVRILTKQIHFFGNAADLDHTPMFQLRQIAQPMVNTQIYAFLRSLIKRWPLDDSFSNVLELWLSYIQPWRYSFERTYAIQRGATDVVIETQQIHPRFEYFIKENMVSYTQMLVQLLPRFERLDLSSLANVTMMNRLLKVFAQSNLAELLRANEFDVYASKSLLSSSSPKRTKPVTQVGRSIMNEWSPYREDVLLSNEEEASGYVCMFGDEVQQQIRHLCEKMLVTRQVEMDRLGYLLAERSQRYKGLKRYFKWLLVNDEDTVFDQTISNCQKIPEMLDRMLQQLMGIFLIDLPDEAFLMRRDVSAWEASRSDATDLSFTDFSGASRSLVCGIWYLI